MFFLVDLFLLTLNGKLECFEERHIKGMLNIITFLCLIQIHVVECWKGCGYACRNVAEQFECGEWNIYCISK